MTGVTPGGMPYVTPADAVTNYPVTSLALGNAIDAALQVLRDLAVVTDWNGAPAYAYSRNLFGSNAANAPLAGDIIGSVVTTSNGWATQRAWSIDPAQPLVYTRKRTSAGVWQAWSVELAPEYVGQVNVTVSAAIAGTAAVTFPVGRFPSAPLVVATAYGTSVYVAYMSSITSAGMTVGLRHVDNIAGSITAAIYLIARLAG